MASEKTPNLGLNQIDRTSPKTTYFDLEKYLDQNWRAVDDFAGDVNDGVNEIKKRLDTTERKAVTLEPGVQIVHAEKAAPFSLSGITGRTLVNLLGRAGSCDQISSLLGWEADLAVDTSNKAQGAGSIKVTAKNAAGVYNVYSAGLKLTGGRYYIALADVKNINASNSIYVNFSAGGNKALKQSMDPSKFVTIYTKYAPANDTPTNLEVSSISTATGQAFYADAIRLYEVSASEYAALDSMTPEQVAVKYPYVDSVMPARNPYAIRYGENLLPPFYEWLTTGHKLSINSPYSIEGELLSGAIGTDAYAVIYLDVIPNKEYTITNPAESTGKVRISAFNNAGTRIQGIFINPGESRVIKMDASAVRIGVNVSGVTQYTNEFDVNAWSWPVGTKRKFYNPILNVGSTAKPFKPREDSMLALQTDLYADPVTGANADTVFERDGQYFKSKRWQGLMLDGSRAWIPGEGGATNGNRQVKVTGLAIGAVAGSGIGTKYDGKLLPQGSTGSSADTNAVTAAGEIYFGIPVADSGWADGYQPTQDDIKAYFYGYKAYDANTITPAQAQAATSATWNGTGTKYWVQCIGAPNFTQSVPQQAYAGYTPYQLVYQLATPTVEPIVSEGQLSFIEGENQVEVGTGIVLREKAKLYQELDTKRWNINNGSPGEYQASLLSYRVNRFIGIYNNSKPDTWTLYPNTTTPAGALAHKISSDFDTFAAYTVSYLAFISSPIVPFTGSYAANEKTLLTDLVDNVQQNATRVSVLENKKAEKDNQSWITPTLLNGVTGETTGPDFQPQYIKMSDGLIKMHGSIKVPTSNATVTFFRLPEGYRPKTLTVLTCAASDAVSADKTAVIAISPDGRVEVVGRGGYGWIRLDAVQFIAEV
ncbi:hypothetical protein [Paenibacillus sp. 1-18]|uniref:hypothetical protein n=1 Tax=Paenibacillus sp. 1-18 TaxID=1333846 RepID=UPI00046FA31A|nr:hypothetical protein [Paenibacillus sp. 1-18]